MQTAQFIEAAVRSAGALDTGLLVPRLVFGLTLSAHGAQRLFGWFGGDSLTSTGGFFELLGFRLLGSVGFALMLSVMIVAAGAVHRTRGFFATTNGIELLRGGGCIPAK
jgi:putative oxidoreductase